MDGGFVHRGPLRSAEHRRAPRVSAPKGSRPRMAASRLRAQDAHSADPLGDREAQGTARQEGARRTAGGVLEVQEALHKQGLLLAPRKRRETPCRLRQQNKPARKTTATRKPCGGRAARSAPTAETSRHDASDKIDRWRSRSARRSCRRAAVPDTASDATRPISRPLRAAWFVRAPRSVPHSGVDRRALPRMGGPPAAGR